MTQQRSDDENRADLAIYRAGAYENELSWDYARNRLIRDVAPLLARAERAEAQVQRVEALCETEPGDENEGRISKAMLRAALGGTE